MSITDELRKSADDIASMAVPCGASPDYMGVRRKIDTIADRIDAEHEHELDHVRNQASEGLAKQWNNGYDVGFASADDWLEQHEGAMAEHGWYRALDADKQLIHIGDRMEHIDLGYVLEVIAVGVDCFIAWNTHLNRYCQYDSKLFRHHHEPTLEDVLTEFALEIDPSADIAVTGAETIKKFAAKLQLKEPNE